MSELIDKPSKPPWFNETVSNVIINYDDRTFKNSPFTKIDKNINNEIFKTEKSAKITFTANKTCDINKELMKHLNKYLDKYNEIPNDKQQKKDELTTKFNRQVNEIDTVIKTRKYFIDFNNKQKTILYSWITSCRLLYNKCVDKINTNNKYFNNGFKAIKSEFFNEIYGNNKKPAPYDVLSHVVIDFCANLKSAFTNLKKGNIKRFKMRKLVKTAVNYSLYIPLKSIQTEGIFRTILGKVNNFPKLDTSHDCRLFYNYNMDTFTLLVPTSYYCRPIANRESICAIDPGESKFISFYGLQSYGYIGKDIRQPLLKIRDKISRYQKILKRNTNKKNTKLRNKKQIIRKINKLYKKSKNIVKELHNQSANYLCKSYDKILIPKFETQKMVRTYKKTFKQYKLECINKSKTLEERKEIARNLTKRCRLSKNVKYVLNQLSHYSFRQHLTNKAKEHGCLVKVVSEEYTSKTCTNCGCISDSYNKERVKSCKNCNYKIDRDTNGARNILIKNIGVFKNNLRL